MLTTQKNKNFKDYALKSLNGEHLSNIKNSINSEF